MPFTTYHLASSLLAGLVLRGYVNWPALLIVSTFLVDVEPLAKAVLGIEGPLHGLTHTFLAAATLGPASGLVLYAARGLLRPLSAAFKLESAESPWAYALGGAAGWALHVFMDAPLYPEMEPFYPAGGNPLLLASIDPYASWLRLARMYEAVLAFGFFSYAAYLYFSYGRGAAGRSAAGLALMAALPAAISATSEGARALFLGALLGIYLLYSALWRLAPRRRISLVAAALLLSASLLLMARHLFFFADLEAFVDSLGWATAYVLSWYIPLVAAFILTWPVLRDLGAARPWLYVLAAGVATLWMLIGAPLVAIGLVGLLATAPRMLTGNAQTGIQGSASRPAGV
ncbi:MAG: hypothetical protein ACP5HD_02560 [Thermoproteus sp.]